MHNFKTEGIVIKRKNYGEADRMITFYTKKHGKLQVKATGVRKITSKRSPHVELLNFSEISVYKGKTYPLLIEANVIEDFAAIKNDLTKIGFAYHICELIEGLCPEGEAHEAVFELLSRTLHGLALRKHNELENAVILNDKAVSQGGIYDTAWDTSLAKESKSYTNYIHDFEVNLLSLLGYWHGTAELTAKLDTENFIENIIERRLKSKRIFSKI